MMSFRDLKLRFYKRKKVLKEATRVNRNYEFVFKLKIEDERNPHEFETEFTMVVPGKAAFFAKRKLLDAILLKMELEILNTRVLSSEEAESFEKQKELHNFEKNNIDE